LGDTNLTSLEQQTKSNKAFLFPKAVAIIGMLAVSIILASGAFAIAEERDTGKKKSSIKNYEKLKAFSEILSLVESSYVEEVDSEDLINGAISGMVKSLDPHSSYLPPKSYKNMLVDTSGKFGGLGIEISIKKGILTVVSPIEETPAFKVGIQAGDKIIKIEDESTLDMTLTDAVSRLRGKTGEPITITIFRESLDAPKEYTIVRDIIKVRSVVKKVYRNDIGYVKIRSFSKSTSADLDTALAEFQRIGVSRLILDVRNNPGGLLNQAVEVSDRFLKKENLIVYTKGRTNEQNMRFTTHDKVNRVSYPMIVLVNGGSASASEIVAGALQDLGRAIILGTTTFGKGSVQTIIPLTDGSALRLTTARYYTPSGRIIQENGIEPDIIVEMPFPSELKEDEKDGEKKNPEKEKLRRYLREKDLKKHLKGKKSYDGVDERDSTEIEKEEAKAKEKEKAEDNALLEAELKKDPQLKTALALLEGWDIMKKTLKSTPKRDDSLIRNQISMKK
jgi:carboxyl-terminal processing protease